MPTSEPARALGTVSQRRGDAATDGDQTQPADRPSRRRPQLLVEDDAHPLAALGKVQHPFGAAIAVLLQEQPLDAELNALRLVGARDDVRALAAFVVDGHDALAVALHEVDPGDESEPARRQSDGAGAEPLRLAESLGRRERSILAIDSAVRMGTRDSIGTLRPLALHPLEVGQTRAVDVLVHHPCGEKRRVLRQGRRLQQQLALLGIVRHRLLASALTPRRDASSARPADR